jgi:hypothetical protein
LGCRGRSCEGGSRAARATGGCGQR